MLIAEAHKVIDDYARWINQSIVAIQRGNAVEIVTPVLNHDNDHMSVLLGERDDNRYVVTDQGLVIGNLEFGGASVSTGQRNEKLERILSGYGFKRNADNELYVCATKDELPLRINMLLQAMASIDDMYLLAQDTVRNLFSEDVATWMLEHDVRFVDGPSFMGKSGLSYRFDFAIGRSKTAPERLLKVVNTPKRENVTNALFWWNDVEAVRKESKGYLFLNAHNARNGVIQEEVLNACRNYGVTPVSWGVNEEQYLPELVA